MKHLDIKVQGIVQGVGFRPFIKNLADRLGIKGYVINSSEGVEIKCVAEDHILKEFLGKIKTEAPPLSHIVWLDVVEVAASELSTFNDFIIKESERFAGKLTLVAADVATCHECLAEIEDPSSRRFHYPFTNCTNCGPRYSIIENLPYDRPYTVMKEFLMCDDCRSEYTNSQDRRFHAQPIACPKCGPKIWLNYKGKIISDNDEVLKTAAKAIDIGEIIALKGLGGYHLICDAFSDKAINKLRTVKKRASKPLAVMVKSVEILDKYINLEGVAREIFLSQSSPIVLTEWLNPPFSPHVAPLSNKIGVMRAYTPLHFLLFDYLKTDFIIATSGNLRDEPICCDEDEAENILKSFTDIFLHHNRKIHNRVDDSVVAAINKGYTVLRRARGFAPFPVLIKGGDENQKKEIFASGANLKSSIAFYKNGFAFLSQYIGDLDNVETENFYRQTFNEMSSLFGVDLTEAVKDLHPDYRSSRFADGLHLPVNEVQHHVAHFAACICENAFYGDAIGVVMDGFGLGADKKSGWGGEFFIKKDAKIYRKYHLRPFVQPGLDSAAKHPCRMAVSYIYSAGLLERYESYLSEKLGMDKNEIALIKAASDKLINSIYTTSAGRLFEAVGSIVLGKRSNEYEGELAVNLENIASKNVADFYEFSTAEAWLDPSAVFGFILDDMERGTTAGIISAKFHNGFARAIVDVCKVIRQTDGINTVALSGGVFQNIYLLNRVSETLVAEGFQRLVHTKVPANDQGVALGQLNAVLLNLDLII